MNQSGQRQLFYDKRAATTILNLKNSTQDMQIL